MKPYAYAGMEAPIFFAVMVLIEGLLVHGYSQVSQPISDLGAYSLYGSHAVLQTLNFWGFGVLVLTFAVGLGLALPRSGMVSNTLIVFAVLAASAGFFPDQPNPYPGAVHVLVSLLAFILVILSQFFLWRRLRHSKDEERAVWGRYGTFSLVTGVLSIILLGAFALSFGSPYDGLAERAFVAVPFLWIEVIAIALYRSRWREGRRPDFV